MSREFAIGCAVVGIALGTFTCTQLGANKSSFQDPDKTAAGPPQQSYRQYSAHLWLTGVYEVPGRHGSKLLTFTEPGRFRYRESNWLSNCPDFVNGVPGDAYIASNGLIILRSTLGNDSPDAPTVALDLIPVKWGERHYLIETCEMISFCSTANKLELLSKLPTYVGLLRCGDESKPIYGIPEIPDRYRRYLRTHPIRGRIIEIVDSNEVFEPAGGWIRRDTTVQLNVRDLQGVIEGEVFWRQARVTADQRIAAKVVQVDENSSIALIQQFCRPPAGVSGPQIGWEFVVNANPLLSPTR